MQNDQRELLEENNQGIWWNKIHLVALIGLLIRIVVVFVSDRILHSDEIFQYLEQAHRLEFGYGIIPWEYRYGIRSWIIPKIIFGILHTLHILHFDDPDIYIPAIKISFCIVSISLIYSTYIITRNIASETAGRLAAVITCFWYELVYFANKVTPEILSSYCLVLAVAYFIIKRNMASNILLAFLLSLAAIFRFHYLPLVFILAILANFKQKKKEILVFVTVFALTIIAAGYIDNLTWGSFFASYYNNYLYNRVYKVAELFGSSSPEYFVKCLFYVSGGLFFISILISCIPSNISKTWLPLLCILAIVLPHSLITHKEYRFIFAAIPFCIVLLSIVVTRFALNPKVIKYISQKNYFYFVVSFALLISINGFFLKLPYQGKVYEKPIVSREPNLSAYLFINKEKNLTAILNTSAKWYRTGGYYYLHRNVPIYYSNSLDKINPSDYALYVSHIVANKKDEPTPGFKTVASFEDIEVRKIINPPDKYIKLDVDTFNMFQPGVDDKYIPYLKVF